MAYNDTDSLAKYLEKYFAKLELYAVLLGARMTQQASKTKYKILKLKSFFSIEKKKKQDFQLKRKIRSGDEINYL